MLFLFAALLPIGMYTLQVPLASYCSAAQELQFYYLGTDQGIGLLTISTEGNNLRA